MSGPKPRRVPVDELAGNLEVRAMAGGITRATLLEWRANRGFPAPVATLAAGELWDRRDVQRWLRKHRPQLAA